MKAKSTPIEEMPPERKAHRGSLKRISPAAAQDWATFGSITPGDGLAILLELDPQCPTVEDLVDGVAGLLPGSRALVAGWPFEPGAQLAWLLQRWGSDVHPGRTPLAYFIEWARSKGVPVPVGLEAAVGASEAPLQRPGGQTDAHPAQAPTEGAENLEGSSNKMPALRKLEHQCEAYREQHGKYPRADTVGTWARGEGMTQTQAEIARSLLVPEGADGRGRLRGAGARKK